MANKWRHYQTDSEEEKIWTTVDSDMVTNLMLFFLMLYALTRLSADDRQKIEKGMEEQFRGKTDVEAKAEKVLKEYHEQDAASRVTKLMKKQGLSEYTSVEINEKQIKITLTVPVLFGSGDAELTNFAKKALSGVAKILTSVDNKTIIEGHTDNIPIAKGKYKSNWELSIARAYSVIEYFSEEKKIDPARFIAAGYGEFRPVAGNDTRENRAKNRRIEMVMIR